MSITKCRTKLLAYQNEGVAGLTAKRGRALLADEMGLGKTLQALYWALIARRSKLIVVICPAMLKWNWYDELYRHFRIRAEVLSGRKPRRHRLAGHQPIIVLNYELVQGWTQYLCELQPDVVIIDEAHYVSNREAQRSQHVKDFVRLAKIPCRIALTGTPITNRPSDLWMILNIVKPGMYPSYTKYGIEFCKPRIKNGKWTFDGAANLDKLHRRLHSRVMIRRLKEDVLSQLPKKERKMVPVSLSDRDMKEYKFAETHFLDWIKQKYPERLWKVQRAEKLVKIGYLLRLVAKMKRFLVREWIQNFLEGSDRKLVIFTERKPLIKFICANFPDIVVRIDGSVSTDDRHQAVRAFQKNPRIRIAACNYRAAGVGTTMTAASDVLITDFPYSPAVIGQAEDRVHRIGQNRQCTMWYLPARATIEHRLVDIFINKTQIVREALDARKINTELDVFRAIRKLLKS